MISKEELKKLDVASLKREAGSLKKEIFNLRLGVITGQVKDVSQFGKLRRQVARVLTLARKQEESVEQKVNTSVKVG